MTDMPAAVLVGHHYYTIEVVPDEQAWNGLTDNEHQRIKVADGLGPHVLRTVIMHEVFHALNAVYIPGQILGNLKWRKGDLDELICYNLAGPMVALLTDNPDLVAWLLDVEEEADDDPDSE